MELSVGLDPEVASRKKGRKKHHVPPGGRGKLKLRDCLARPQAFLTKATGLLLLPPKTLRTMNFLICLRWILFKGGLWEIFFSGGRKVYL